MAITGTYFKTCNPSVLDQWNDFTEAVNQWKRDVDAFCARVGAESAYGGIRGGKAVVQALRFTDQPPSRWKREGRGHAPYKNNPLSGEFDGLTRSVLTLEGVESTKLIEAPSGRMMFVSPLVFLLEGCLYLTYSDLETSIDSDAWELISGGDFLIARGMQVNQKETRND